MQKFDKVAILLELDSEAYYTPVNATRWEGHCLSLQSMLFGGLELNANLLSTPCVVTGDIPLSMAVVSKYCCS